MAEAVKKFARSRFLRRTSEHSSTASTTPSPDSDLLPRDRPKNTRKSSLHSLGLSLIHEDKPDEVSPSTVAEPTEEVATKGSAPRDAPALDGDVDIAESLPSAKLHRPPTLLIQAPSSPELAAHHKLPNEQPVTSNKQLESSEQPDPVEPNPLPPSPSRQSFTRPPLTRTSTRGSYIGKSGMLLGSTHTRPSTRDSDTNDAFEDAVQTQPRKMAKRKVWVRRPGASATLVQYNEDDLVDDVRDTILRKYANSLGRTFDSPDMTLKVHPRERSNHSAQERTLGPEEPVSRILDAYFPGGQDVNEALLIDVPPKRTPRASPRVIHRTSNEYYDDLRPAEEDAGYFPPMPIAGQLTPQGRNVYTATHPPHSISILETGQVPPLPSPREKRSRPRPHRQHTSSPTAVSSASSTQPHPGLPYHASRQPRTRRDSNDRLKNSTHIPAPPPLPASPNQDVPAAALAASGHPVSTPPAITHPAAAAISPRLAPTSAKKRIRKSMAHRDSATPRDIASPYFGDPDSETSVPPINVLIVEDNIINLRVLEMMVGKLKVRWATAMNGRDAVTKWREGGYHLVLMDIQLPIMSGLEATKEIRRLERVNGIGVFAREEDGSITNGVNGVNGHSALANGTGAALARKPSKETTLEDTLGKAGQFKSPVIIVALTASSLQSDRREALAAGCNDFLTKPVNFTWFSQKVKEWGCMQALIDFDGWRAWKNLSLAEDEKKMKAMEDETDEDRKKREKREEKERRRMEMLKKMGK